MKGLRRYTLRVKEWTNFETANKATHPTKLSGKFPLPKSNTTDFWWDIRNNVFFSYNRPFMERIEFFLKETFTCMDKE